MAGVDNLKPFKEGFDPRRNLDGAPKKLDLTESITKVLNEEKDGMIALDAVLIALRNKAVKGDVRAIQELLDRAFGKSLQKTHTDGNLKIELPKLEWLDE